MRYPDWQQRFEEFIKARQNTPFAWGTNDCATFAADCVQAITGNDPAPAGLRDHSSALQAARMLKQYGGLAAIATEALGEPLQGAFAQIGDVVLCKAGDEDMLAICNGSTALAPSPVGLAAVEFGTLCWRVA